MKILPIANNQVQNQNRNSNQNFGSMKVLAEHIPNFQKICPDVTSLSEYIGGRIHDYGTGLIQDMRKIIDGVGDDLPFATKAVLITEDERQILDDLAAKATTEMHSVSKDQVKTVFSNKYLANAKNPINTLLKKIVALATTEAHDVSPEQIETFMPQVRATQDAFIKECSGK